MSNPPGSWDRIYNPESGQTPAEEGWFHDDPSDLSDGVVADRYEFTFDDAPYDFGEDSDDGDPSPLRNAITTSFEVLGGDPVIDVKLTNEDGRYVQIHINRAFDDSWQILWINFLSFPFPFIDLTAALLAQPGAPAEFDFSTGQHTILLECLWEDGTVYPDTSEDNHFRITVDGAGPMLLSGPMDIDDPANEALLRWGGTSPEIAIDYFAVGLGSGGGGWTVGSVGWS